MTLSLPAARWAMRSWFRRTPQLDLLYSSGQPAAFQRRISAMGSPGFPGARWAGASWASSLFPRSTARWAL
jgi:hypothetical protein